MNRVLEAIAAERSELTARLQALEEMERLCRVFDADSPVELAAVLDADGTYRPAMLGLGVAA